MTYYHSVESCQIPNLSFLYSYFLGERPDGKFVEVGAYDGRTHSNTFGLLQRGWTGLLMEPVAEYARLCEQTVEPYPSAEVATLAAGAANATTTIHIGGFLSSTNSAAIAQYRRLGWGDRMITGETREVAVVTLDSALASRGWSPGFDLLVVDVEGAESEVFEGFSLNAWSPRMMIVELHDGCPVLSLTRRSDWSLQNSIVRNGYSVVYKDHINTVFVLDSVAESAHQTNSP